MNYNTKMLRQAYFIINLFFSCIPLCAFHYDTAAHLMQEGKWSQAYEGLKSLVIDNPDSADILYDAGVAANAMEKHEQAHTYFSRAAEYASSTELESKAYFNAGNTCVLLHTLPEAIKYYDKVLAIDPDNEYAQHNKKVVQQMLEQQKEEEQQKEQQKDNQQEEQQDNKKDQQSSDNKQDNQQQDSNDKRDKSNDEGDEKNKSDGSNNSSDKSGNQKEQNKKNGTEQKNNNEKSSDQSQEQSDQQKRSDGSDGDKSDAGKQERDQKQDSTNGGNDKQRQRDHQAQNDLDEKEGKQNSEQRNNHGTTPEKEKQNDAPQSTAASDNNKELIEASEQSEEAMAQNLQEKLHDPWLVSVLQKQEEKDRATNKQLMAAKVQQCGGKNEQNCW